MENIVKLNPTVCVVGKTYQIAIVTEKDALISVKVGDKFYYNHSNGIRVSSKGVHKISVPQSHLDTEKKYTVIAKEMTKRLAYFSETEPEVEKEYNFKPLNKTENINIYHLADVHGMQSRAVNAAKKCGQSIDLLILNGDISSTSDTFDDMILCYKIASEITKGEFACIISRGNHDLRGFGAEKLADYMPTDNGKSYYTFKVGCIWGILVDTGEDKDDNSPEYGNTVCCHDFRIEQEKKIKNIIKNADSEYAEDGVKYKFIISHVPFIFKRKAPFDIERELYSSWSKLMKENINPHLMLCGHTHKACISECGSEYDDLGQPCTIVVGSDVSYDENNKAILSGALINLKQGFADITFNSENAACDTQTVVL